MDNVTSLFGGGFDGGDGQEPDAAIIEILEEALQLAKDGQIQDLLLVYHDGANLSRSWPAQNFQQLSDIHFAASASLMQMQASLLQAGDVD